MNIGIDARLLHNATGIGRYTRSLFFEFLQRPRDSDNYFLFSDRHFPDMLDAPGLKQTDFPSHVRVLIAPCTTRILWTNLFIPTLLKYHQIDVYHGVCNFELPLRKVCRYVVTIHDLVPLFFPHVVPWKHRLFFKLFMKPVAQTADIILTDSVHSQHDIARYLKVPREKIRVIYLGYTPHPEQPHQRQNPQEILHTYGITQPYVLFLGVIEPKKNLDRLIEAFALLQRMSTIKPLPQLVLAGHKGWLCEHLAQRAQQLGVADHVVLTGFVSEQHLAIVYQHADLFVFPSLYEGFGFPIVEAMAYGVPVVTSQASSLPEIAGDAAILVDPHSPESIRDGMADVLLNPQQADEMREKGRQQVQKFSWHRTATETYQAYHDAYRMEKETRGRR